LRNLHIIKDTGRRPSDIFYDQSQIDVIPRLGRVVIFRKWLTVFLDTALFAFGFMLIPAFSTHD